MDAAGAAEPVRLMAAGGGAARHADVALRPCGLGRPVHHPTSTARGDAGGPPQSVGVGYWIIDRRNGRVTGWPSLPPDMVITTYREQYDGHPPRHAVHGAQA
ncbi:hypothetical protein [Streptomyces sp. NPDC017890]|uniref:hypothetical protein n=1 Tax=Streptomyces sp. NPDC017890 TaxID=3365015 RepID=UPI0037A09E24